MRRGLSAKGRRATGACVAWPCLMNILVDSPPVSCAEISDGLLLSADFRYQNRKRGSPLRREASLVAALWHQILNVQRGMRR